MDNELTNNPLYNRQWHFDLLRDIETIWTEFTGEGVSIAVYDDGVQSSHPDLDDNYDTSLEYEVYDGDYTQVAFDEFGNPTTPGSHGTSVSGIIAGENNDVGGVGVAWGASITGVDYLNLEFTNSFTEFLYYYDVTAYMSTFDIVNQSYGYVADFNEALSLGEEGSFGQDEFGWHYDAAVAGRDGLGTVLVKSAGNGANDTFNEIFGIFGNAQGDSSNNWHFGITIGALEEDGFVADYSNFGANILVSAGAAAFTTDLTGADGFSSGDFAGDFGGTSAATPVVSGVIALMLEANPDLSVLDIQMILAVSAAMTGSALGETGQGYEAGEWVSVGDGSWNGGGLTYNPSYGYGAVDAFAAVRMAEVWHIFEDQRLLSEQLSVSIANSEQQNINQHSPTEIVFDVTENVEIDHVYVTIDLYHTSIESLQIYITSPDGVQFDLLNEEGGDNVIDYSWTFSLASFRGTEAEGEWTVTIDNAKHQGFGTVYGVDLDFLGAEVDEYGEDVWHFTDDFLDLASVEGDRTVIGDGDGGFDVINLAALTGDVVATLGLDEVVSVDGQVWVTQEFGDISGIFTGDGDDWLTGSDLTNGILGARGDDVISGAGGEDILSGAQGDDLILGEEHGGYGTLESAQVFRLFNSVFNRAPGSDGHQFWVTQLLSGNLTLSEIAERFINVPEFQITYGTTTDIEFVSLLFNNILGRTPQEAGLNFWVDEISDGNRTRAEVLRSISEALENQNLTATDLETFEEGADATVFAPRIYRLFEALFGRAPAKEGFEAWAERFEDGLSFTDAVETFIATDEFQVRYSDTDNEGFIRLLFNNVLGREPGEAGLAAWIDSLENGMTREAVVEFFVDSEEFVRKTGDAVFEFMTDFGGDDKISGGAGTNIVAGGLYSDQFEFRAEDEGTTTILDWEAWDTLNFGGFGYADGSDVMAHLSQSGDQVIFEDQGTTVVFQDTELADILEMQITVGDGIFV